MIRTIRYLRVSSIEQAKDSRYGYARQRIIAARSEVKHGLEMVAEVTDQVSGAESMRPGLASIPELARQHGATAISLSEVDRLSRDIPGGYAIIAELLSTKLDIFSHDLQRRVNFRDIDSVKEVNDRLREAHLEKAGIRNRTYIGRLAKAADGLTIRPLSLYGYLDGQPLERQAVWVRYAFELGLEWGAKPIAEKLIEEGAPAPGVKPWSTHKIHALLSDPTYKGEAGFGRELYCAACHEYRLGNQYDARRGYGTCKRCGGQMALNRIMVPVPSLVSVELWDAVAAARQARDSVHGKRGRRNALYPLTGRILCGVCGRSMNGMSTNGRNHYYRCSLGRRRGPGRCQHRTGYRAERVHEAVLIELYKLAERPGAIEAALAEHEADPYRDERKRVEAARTELTATLGRIEEGFVSGIVGLERSLAMRRDTEAKLRALPKLMPAPVRRVDAEELRRRLAAALAERPLAETIVIVGARVTIGLDGVANVAIR